MVAQVHTGFGLRFDTGVWRGGGPPPSTAGFQAMEGSISNSPAVGWGNTTRAPQCSPSSEPGITPPQYAGSPCQQYTNLRPNLRSQAAEGQTSTTPRLAQHTNSGTSSDAEHRMTDCETSARLTTRQLHLHMTDCEAAPPPRSMRAWHGVQCNDAGSTCQPEATRTAARHQGSKGGLTLS